MGRLDNKVCLITGAARGQGAEEARLFAHEGATVWLTDVLDEVGEATAKEIGATYRHLDVRSEARLERSGRRHPETRRTHRRVRQQRRHLSFEPLARHVAWRNSRR